MNEGSNLDSIVTDILPLVSGKEILDVGTGFGTVVSRLLKLEGTRVVSIDPESWSFDRIREEYVEELNTGRLALHESKAEEMPFENSRFDSSLSICSLHHLRNPSAGIREMERVTSGSVILTDWNPSTGGEINPHSPEELESSKKNILEYTQKRGYGFEERGSWFLVWKQG